MIKKRATIKKTIREIQPKQTRGKLLYFQPQASTLWLYSSRFLHLFPAAILRLLENCFLTLLPSITNVLDSWRAEQIETKPQRVRCEIVAMMHILIQYCFLVSCFLLARSHHLCHYLPMLELNMWVYMHFRAFLTPNWNRNRTHRAHHRLQFFFMHNLFATIGIHELLWNIVSRNICGWNAGESISANKHIWTTSLVSGVVCMRFSN